MYIFIKTILVLFSYYEKSFWFITTIAVVSSSLSRTFLRGNTRLTLQFALDSKTRELFIPSPKPIAYCLSYPAAYISIM